MEGVSFLSDSHSHFPDIFLVEMNPVPARMDWYEPRVDLEQHWGAGGRGARATRNWLEISPELQCSGRSCVGACGSVYRVLSHLCARVPSPHCPAQTAGSECGAHQFPALVSDS